MAKANKKSKKSLSEQLQELSTPKPVSYNPDQEDQSDLTAAKVVEFPYETEEPSHKRRKLLREEEREDDPKYSGRAVSRRDLQDSSEGSQCYTTAVFRVLAFCSAERKYHSRDILVIFHVGNRLRTHVNCTWSV